MQSQKVSELIDLLEQMGQVYGETARKIVAMERLLRNKYPELHKLYSEELAGITDSDAKFSYRINQLRKSLQPNS